MIYSNQPTYQILNHLKRAPKDKILKHVDIIARTLERPGSKDSIKGVFGISSKVYEKIINKAKKKIYSIKAGISEE
jgi:poly-D-alanine transfer protein DltD